MTRESVFSKEQDEDGSTESSPSPTKEGRVRMSKKNAGLPEIRTQEEMST